MQTDRSIRVFISSTFRDMHEERELLVKHVFPQLDKLCRSRDVTFTSVDLRWGITEQQAQQGEVLPICLAEIDRCRPYFIGLLGERYGWVPETIPEELIEDQPWLAEHRDQSVTALEIFHGVLNNPRMSNRALFYFRDAGFIERLPGDQRTDYLEPDADAREKHARLKQTIRDRELAIRESGREGHQRVKGTLAEMRHLLRYLQELSGLTRSNRRTP